MIDSRRPLARLLRREAGGRRLSGPITNAGRILALAAVLFGVATGVDSLIGHIGHYDPGKPGQVPTDLLWIVCVVTAPLAGRYTAPTVTAALATAAFTPWAANYIYAWLGFSVAAFAVGTARRRIALAVTLVGSGIWAVWLVTRDPLLLSGMIWGVLPSIALPAAIGWALGTVIHRLEVAEEALADADGRAQAARHEERIRLSRELHDSVARDLTIISMHAALLRRAALSEDHAYSRTAIEDTSRAALADLKRLLTVLRTEDSAAGPVFTRDADADDLPGAVGAAAARLSALGFTVRSRVDTPVPLPRITQATLVRALKESEANVAKHAPRGADCVIEVRTERRDAVLVVTNTLVGGQSSGLPSTGVGLPAVRERVTLLGGELTAHTEGGIWLLRARVPLDPAPEPSVSGVLRR